MITLIGPPYYTVPWYTAPPFGGRQISKGLGTGTMYGPVLRIHRSPDVAHDVWAQGVKYPKSSGFVSVEVPNPLYRLPDTAHVQPEVSDFKTIWINVWTSRNKEGHPPGIAYCDVIFEDRNVLAERSSYGPAPFASASSSEGEKEPSSQHSWWRDDPRGEPPRPSSSSHEPSAGADQQDDRAPGRWIPPSRKKRPWETQDTRDEFERLDRKQRIEKNLLRLHREEVSRPSGEDEMDPDSEPTTSGVGSLLGNASNSDGLGPWTQGDVPGGGVVNVDLTSSGTEDGSGNATGTEDGDASWSDGREAEIGTIGTVVTPMMNSDAVLALIGGDVGAPEDTQAFVHIPPVMNKLAKIAEGIKNCFPQVWLGNMKSAEQWIQATADQGVFYAEGTSDDETVRSGIRHRSFSFF